MPPAPMTPKVDFACLVCHASVDSSDRCLAEYALITFTSPAAICRMSSSVNVGKAKQVNVCVSCQRALGTSTLL